MRVTAIRGIAVFPAGHDHMDGNAPSIDGYRPELHLNLPEEEPPTTRDRYNKLQRCCQEPLIADHKMAIAPSCDNVATRERTAKQSVSENVD